ncbi:hypothetical protein NPIL_197541 [Nephila pilipes]|uniref:Uncharacterized protein n=1 Tax=Nephila pilipes TaxID=299642 RepID=A0A8X6QK09_NEPPI|nr:hypothetical protein NPIL_197541 [Nephila pilipes]
MTEILLKSSHALEDAILVETILARNSGETLLGKRGGRTCLRCHKEQTLKFLDIEEAWEATRNWKGDISHQELLNYRRGTVRAKKLVQPQASPSFARVTKLLIAFQTKSNITEIIRFPIDLLSQSRQMPYPSSTLSHPNHPRPLRHTLYFPLLP